MDANLEQVERRGGDAAFVADGKAKADTLEELDIRQEALKAELKTATKSVQAAQKDAIAWRSEAAAIVRLAFRDAKERWVEFGL